MEATTKIARAARVRGERCLSRPGIRDFERTRYEFYHRRVTSRRVLICYESVMYSVMSYGHMAADGVRMDAYARAIARTVQPGSVVLDLGAGTGIMSLLAAKAGARKVYAVDVNPAVSLLHDLARENGVSDRIEIHDTSSFELELDEKADVIVSDLRGSLPLKDEHLALIRDARERWLGPLGVLVPAQDRLMVALVESSKLTRDFERALVGFSRRGLSADAARSSMVHSVFVDDAGTVSASDVLSSADCWATLDYATVTSDVFEGTVDLTIRRGGRANALALWFETTVYDDIGYSTGPGHTGAYSRILLPLLEPVDVTAGGRAVVTLRTHARGDRWAWETSLSGPDATSKCHFRQATFLGMPTSPAALLRAASHHAPVRNARGDRALRTLTSMNGELTVSEIIDLVATDSPLARSVIVDDVRDAVARYGR